MKPLNSKVRLWWSFLKDIFIFMDDKGVEISGTKFGMIASYG